MGTQTGEAKLVSLNPGESGRDSDTRAWRTGRVEAPKAESGGPGDRPAHRASGAGGGESIVGVSLEAEWREVAGSWSYRPRCGPGSRGWVGEVLPWGLEARLMLTLRRL